MAHRAWSWTLTYILIVMSTVGWRGREDGKAATQQEHRRSVAVPSDQVRSDPIRSDVCDVGQIGWAPYTTQPAERVREGGHGVARTTVEDRTNVTDYWQAGRR